MSYEMSMSGLQFWLDGAQVASYHDGCWILERCGVLEAGRSWIGLRGQNMEEDRHEGPLLTIFYSPNASPSPDIQDALGFAHRSQRQSAIKSQHEKMMLEILTTSLSIQSLISGMGNWSSVYPAGFVPSHRLGGSNLILCQSSPVIYLMLV